MNLKPHLPSPFGQNAETPKSSLVAPSSPLQVLGSIRSADDPRYGPRRRPSAYTPGMRVEVSHGAGVDSGRQGVVLPASEAHLVNRGDDRQYREPGRYKDFDPAREVLIRDDRGEVFGMFKNYLHEIPLDHSGIKTKEGRNYTAGRYADGSYLVTKDRNNTGDSTPVRLLPGVATSFAEAVKSADADSLARQEFTEVLGSFKTRYAGDCSLGAVQGFSVRTVTPTAEHPQNWGLYATFYAKNTWHPVEGFAPSLGPDQVAPLLGDPVSLTPDPEALRRLWSEERIASSLQKVRDAAEILHKHSTGQVAVEIRASFSAVDGNPCFVYIDEEIPLLPLESILDLTIRDPRLPAIQEVETTLRLALAERANRSGPSHHEGPALVLDALKGGKWISEGVLFETFRGGADAADTRRATDRMVTAGFRSPVQHAVWQDRKDWADQAAWRAFRVTLSSILNLQVQGNSQDGFSYHLAEPPSLYHSPESGLVWS